MDPTPTPEPILQLLYPTRSVYLGRYGLATFDSINKIYVRPADGPAVLAEAANAQVP